MPGQIKGSSSISGALQISSGFKRITLGFLISLSGCSQESDFLGGNIHGYNHTSSSINYFFINGFGGAHAGPFSESGAVCCVSLPRKWRPGMMAQVEWQSDPNALVPTPAGAAEFRAFMVEHRKHYRQVSAIVEVPYYEDVCGVEVHFLPCDEVKLSTSCWGYSSPNNPIKEPMRMKEPLVCPKK